MGLVHIIPMPCPQTAGVLSKNDFCSEKSKLNSATVSDQSSSDVHGEVAKLQKLSQCLPVLTGHSESHDINLYVVPKEPEKPVGVLA